MTGTLLDQHDVNVGDLYRHSSALDLYEQLLANNPHLPPARLVNADSLRLHFGLNREPTLTLEVFVVTPGTQEVEPAESDASDLIGPGEAAAILGVSRLTAAKWARNGRAPYVETPTGRRLLLRSWCVEQMKPAQEES